MIMDLIGFLNDFIGDLIGNGLGGISGERRPC